MSNAIIVRAGNVTKNYVDTNLDNKVDKVLGKGLSTNDYDNVAKAAVDALGTASTCDTGTSQGNVPVLNSNGKLDTTILPSLVITDTFTVANEAAMLALSAEKVMSAYELMKTRHIFCKIVLQALLQTGFRLQHQQIWCNQLTEKQVQ